MLEKLKNLDPIDLMEIEKELMCIGNTLSILDNMKLADRESLSSLEKYSIDKAKESFDTLSIFLLGKNILK